MNILNKVFLEHFHNASNSEEFVQLFQNQYSEISVNEETKKKLQKLYAIFKQKWIQSSRHNERFLTKNEEFLNRTFTIQEDEIEDSDVPSTSRGRPSKSLQACSEYTKRRKLLETTSNISTENVSIALSMKYNKDSNKAKADITKAVLSASPLRVQRIKASIPTPQRDPIKYDGPTALALFLDMGLSKEKYKLMRKSLRSHNVDVFPSYNVLMEAKIEATPSNLIITETSVEVNLQDLVDHTAKRIINSLDNRELQILPTQLNLLSKWGCDGSSGQSAYKQRIVSEDGDVVSDANMFMASLVPLRLKGDLNEHWKNPRPSSVHFCRPIMFKYAKESSDIIQTTVSNIRNQIKNLAPTVITLNEEKNVMVRHEFFLTMIDGKVLNELTSTKSTLSCPICKRTQKNFQKEADDLAEADERNYEFGISPLHARIRCMDFVLKLAYGLNQENEATDKKEAEKRRKLEIQKEFREQLGLIIDTPKQGFGNTNDGNTSRRFFENPGVTSAITRVDEELLKKLQVILNALSSMESINIDKFNEYTKSTSDLLKSKYSHKILTPTLHKILDHGGELISHQVLPIGELSEEAQEARNKDYKRYRYSNTCKVSRKRQNEDLFNMLSISSDPLVSSLRHARSHKELKKSYCPELISLLNIKSDDDGSELFTENL